MKYKTHPPGWFLFLTKLFCYVSLVNSQAVVQSNTITYGNSPSGFDDGYIVLGGAYLAFQDMNSVPMYQTVRVDKGVPYTTLTMDCRGLILNLNMLFLLALYFAMMEL